MLLRLRSNPGMVPSLKAHYKANPIDFVSDWGMTTDPRNLALGRPVLIPFVPFPRQREWMQWLLDRWKLGQNGLTEKTRDMGCSVAALSLFSTLALFHRDFVAGIGSRKESLIDGVGDPNTLMHKARTFLKYVPQEFRGGWSESNRTASSHMKIIIPETGSSIVGEAGDNIGRGGRTSITLLDESAHNRNQGAIDLSLSQTTPCRIDLSSVNGTDNKFAEKRFSGQVEVFNFHWRDDPRKSQEWYERECARLPAVIVAQEIDIDYNASKEGILIPGVWVQAAIDSIRVIGAAADNTRVAGQDVADRGEDTNALAFRHSITLADLKEWSGSESDLYATAEKAALACDERGYTKLRYDADGLGAGLRGDYRTINSQDSRKDCQIEAVEHQGSASVVNPDQFAIEPDLKNGHNGRTNKDFFANYKAQSWWSLRVRFEKTYKWVVKGIPCDPADCINIAPDLPHLGQLTQELSRPTYGVMSGGKILVDKAPDGSKSPNLADAVVIAFAPTERKRKGAFDF